MRTALAAAVVLAACTADAPPADDVVDTDAPADPLRAEAGAAIVTLVGETVTFDASASTGVVAARWAFGDGTTTPEGTVLTASHRYEAPGHYRATVEVFGADGAKAVDTVEVTVTWPALAEPPRAASSVVAGAGRVFVALPDFDAVAVVDPEARVVVDHLRPCGAPRRLSFQADASGGGRLAVACEERGGGVAVAEVAPDGSVADPFFRTADIGDAPFAVVLDGAQVVFAGRSRAEGGFVQALHADDLTPAWRTALVDPRGLAAAPGGLVASRHRSPDDAGVFWRIDPATGAATAGTLAPDPGPDSDTNSRGVPTYLQAAAIRPDGRVAVFAGQKANVGRGLVRDGQPLTHETTLRSDLRAVAIVPDEGPIGSQVGQTVLDDRDLIAAVAFHPRGDWLYAVTSGSMTLEVIDAYSFRRVAVVHDVGIAPDGLAVAPDGATAWVHGRWSRSLAFVPLDPVVDAPPFLLDLRPDGADVLPADIVRGAQVFHTSADPRMTQDSYVSCASCHLDGEDDGRVWDFTSRGEGLRDTISLRGMVDRIGLPIHWSANFDEVQDFENDIRGPQAGRGFLTDADWERTRDTLGETKAGLSPDLDALAAWVDQLAVLEVPARAEPEGRAVFVAAGCDDCHPDGGSASRWEARGQPHLVDVGTLTPRSGGRLGGPLPGLDIPDLRGVWASPPYLHDGSAPTLADVVARDTDDRHGVTSALSESEREALVRYLRTL